MLISIKYKKTNNSTVLPILTDSKKESCQIINVLVGILRLVN